MSGILSRVCGVIGVWCVGIMPLLLFPTAGAAVEYFFDSENGVDANAGLTAEAPYRTLAKLAELQLQPGDSVWLKRGGTFRGRLAFRGNGEPGKPIRVGAYGTGPKPEVLGSIEVREWERHEGGVYKCRLPREPGFDTDVYGVFLYDVGTVPRRLLREPDRIPAVPGRFYYDKAANLLYITTPDGSAPGVHRIEVSVIDEILLLDRRAWIEIEGLSLLFGNRRHVSVVDSQHTAVRNCASLFVGSYGNPNVSLIRCTGVDVLSCFLYENANGGVFLTDKTTLCRIADCTIAKSISNDGVTMHSGGRDKDGVRQGITGDCNTVENNVIGLCLEESIDVTSGDGHVIQGNICYGNGNPGIIVGHDSDHILIRNNICFANARAGIQVSGQEDEGARGSDCVVGNLVYRNGYPGLELDSPDCLVANNTVVDSTERAAIRISEKAKGTRLLNNIVVTTSPAISQPSVQFMLGTPTACGVVLERNLYFHVGRPDGRVIQTRDGDLTPAEMAARYGTCRTDLIADPRFLVEPERYCTPAPVSPAMGCGAAVAPVRASGCAAVLGWKAAGDRSGPKYPAALITGKDDDAVVLWLWGKGPAPARRGDEAFLAPDLKAEAAAAVAAVVGFEGQGDLVAAWTWYQAALYNLAEDDPQAIDIRRKVAAFSGQTAVLQAIRRQFAESNLARARELLDAPKKKWDMIAHYLQVAASGLPENDPLRAHVERVVVDHRAELAPYLP
ncbi:MAG: hypothetical protein A3K19_33865 [Lentisphaerae bacterium RIFOXYB12_FULL_65_16]|nr:MAG: hypothetical protein A3K19_26570 [Lentisphaerae bacterium RIFOXYB12_FULL_65_16]OGV95234.1 MAG: hypothetical protein A3K19_33865 [Lentisphaerae bacterium RIFOXYB12_FULL_65_16]